MLCRQIRLKASKILSFGTKIRERIQLQLRISGGWFKNRLKTRDFEKL